MRTLHATADSFPELLELQAILDSPRSEFAVSTLAQPAIQGRRFPILMAALGSAAPNAPTLGMFGGIHGLERIGTQVVLSYMRSLAARLQWDELLHRQLQTVRLVFVPIVNPCGMWAGTRSNANGVDLMRNGPQRAEGQVPFLAGGQRLGPWLPWYCGKPGAAMEEESAALLAMVERELTSRPFSLALDCHSGYGWNDSIWFPYAKTRRLMRHLPEMYALKNMLEEAIPHHDYSFEPQSRQYLLHGDLWDHAYDRAPAAHVFLPMTLELGSWVWIRKNPRQLFSRHGIFNPIKEHRIKRVLRRHASLLDFLTRATYASERWLPLAERRAQLQHQAREYWSPRLAS
jgi:hypothetical protein